MYYCATSVKTDNGYIPVRAEALRPARAAMALAAKLNQLAKTHGKRAIDEAIRDIVSGPVAY